MYRNVIICITKRIYEQVRKLQWSKTTNAYLNTNFYVASYIKVRIFKVLYLFRRFYILFTTRFNHWRDFINFLILNWRYSYCLYVAKICQPNKENSANLDPIKIFVSFCTDKIMFVSVNKKFFGSMKCIILFLPKPPMYTYSMSQIWFITKL